MIKASSRLQTNQVIESKNTSFTVTHLVLKIKEVPSKTENGKKKRLDIYDVDVHSNAPGSQIRQRSSLVCSSLQVFSRCNSIFPGVILLHGLFSFNNALQLDLLLAPTEAVGSPSASEGTGRFQSVKIDRTASLLKLRSTISLCSTIYWQFHL